MPLFDYRCEFCGEVRELLVRSADADPGPCACGGARERLLSAPADLKRMDAFYHKESFSDADIARKGLTKYVNRGDGTYEKAAGSGPSVVSRDQLPG
ncbi:MAG TPA: zinc ribbon domain-containing protein [Holophagaceae bacterium]|nr:zinc ribbon domain-containing protein [Holophagaceae bacterium]